MCTLSWYLFRGGGERRGGRGCYENSALDGLPQIRPKCQLLTLKVFSSDGGAGDRQSGGRGGSRGGVVE